LGAGPFSDDDLHVLSARSLVAAGRHEQAERAYQELTRTSEAATDAAFEAGKAFHLAGLLDRAIEWYRRENGESLGGGSARLEHSRLDLVHLGFSQKLLRDREDAVFDGVQLRPHSLQGRMGLCTELIQVGPDGRESCPELLVQISVSSHVPRKEGQEYNAWTEDILARSRHICQLHGKEREGARQVGPH
jgi:tetratricopeptide repeat protein